MYDITLNSEMIETVDSCKSLASETNKIWCSAVLEIGYEFLGYKADRNNHPKELEELLESAYRAVRQDKGLEDMPFPASEIWRLLISQELEAAEGLFDELYFDDDEQVLDMLEGEAQEGLAESLGYLINGGYWQIIARYLSLPQN